MLLSSKKTKTMNEITERPTLTPEVVKAEIIVSRSTLAFHQNNAVSLLNEKKKPGW